MSFLLMRPDEIASYKATSVTGPVDTTFQPEWICDARPGRPARVTSGSPSWAVTFPSSEVGMLIAGNTNADVNASITGDITTSIVAGALGPNGIRLNGFALVSPANHTNLTITFTGATLPVIIGEFIFGKYRTLSRGLHVDDAETGFTDFAKDTGAEFESVPPYERKLEARTHAGSQIYSTAERDLLIDCWRAQRGKTRPSVIVPDSNLNDAWTGFFQEPKYRQAGPDKWLVTLSFKEIARSRW